jgi:hypothetical protein
VPMTFVISAKGKKFDLYLDLEIVVTLLFHFPHKLHFARNDLSLALFLGAYLLQATSQPLNVDFVVCRKVSRI